MESRKVGLGSIDEYIAAFPEDIQKTLHELAPCELSKGTVGFPIGKPLPLKLISKIVKFRVSENLKKAGIGSRTRK